MPALWKYSEVHCFCVAAQSLPQLVPAGRLALRLCWERPQEFTIAHVSVSGPLYVCAELKTHLGVMSPSEGPSSASCLQLNDVQPIESVCYLIKYDSVHGTWPCKVKDQAEALTGVAALAIWARV